MIRPDISRGSAPGVGVVFAAVISVAACSRVFAAPDAAPPPGSARIATSGVGAHAGPPPAVGIFFDTMSAAQPSAADSTGEAVATPALDAWRRWAHLDPGDSFGLSGYPDGIVVARADRCAHGAGAIVTNVSTHSVCLHLGTHLDAGLWRVEAALATPAAAAAAMSGAATIGPLTVAPPSDGAGGGDANEDGSDAAAGAEPPGRSTAPPTVAVASVRSWRMESVFLSHPSDAYKSVQLDPGETLIVRWTETVADADAACRIARGCDAAHGGPVTYTGVTIAQALARAADLIGEAEVMTLRGKRSEIVRRAQDALLLVAQAQAMARNREDSVPEDDSDAALSRLTESLSEVSCAACNLVPAETAITDSSGVMVAVRVSLTNGGPYTIPSVSLALPMPGDAAGLAAPGLDGTVFRSVAPGATVTARLPVERTASVKPTPASSVIGASGPVSRTIVQFILGMGAAVIPAGPAP
jgi:hypothetical protein